MTKKALNNDSKRAHALDLYLNTDMNQKQICEIVGWTEKTFSANKEKYNWEQQKGAASITSKKIIAKLYIKLEKLVDEDTIKADELIKVTKSIESLSNKKVTASHHMNCAKEFTIWMFGQDADLAKQFNKYQLKFITELASNG